MSRYDRQARLRKVAIDDVQVCATHSAGGHLHEELARRDDGIGNSPALKELPGRGQNHGFHGVLGTRALFA